MERIFAVDMNKGLISIGTNENREANLAHCKELLNMAFSDITYSDISVTAPYGATYINDFLNQLAVIYTNKSKEDITQLLKSFEKEMGRTMEDKKNGVVKIDIDLVCWNKEILKPEDMKRSYIADLLPSIKEN